MSKFLFKYATRGRPELFQQTLRTWVNKLSRLHSYHFIISVDSDDWQMQTPTVKIGADLVDDEKIKYHVYTGKHTTKIDAINRDMEHAGDFDILVLISDDMVPQVQGYDDIIAKDMRNHFQDEFGALHYNDGKANSQLCTLSIMSRKMYEHFGYIYNPVYHSLWADNEFMDVCNNMNKMVYIDRVIIEHQWKHHGDDIVYKNSEAAYDADRRVYLERKEGGFPNG